MQSAHDKTLVCLMGPTASGKTDLAVQLVHEFPFEIISVDSAMIYRGMNIGTAKPDPALLKIAPHRLIDVCDPATAYSAAQFRQDALREIHSIFANGKIPLLVGGTMMYFRALLHGLSDLPSADASLRVKLNQEGEEKGWPYLHARLQSVDPLAAERIHPHDSQRIQRALEVFELTGKNLSDWQQKNAILPADFNVIQIALMPADRTILHERIALRFKKMLQEGFIDEVKKLFARGDLDLTMPSMRCVGYRQVWEYLLGNFSYEEMEQKGIIATRQLAKRQLTWLRHWPELLVFDSEDNKLFERVAKKIT